MKRTSLLNDFIHGSGDASFLCYIGLNCKNLVWETRRQGLEFIASFTNVDRVDLGGAVDETTFCDTESDSSVRARDYRRIVSMSEV